MKRVLVIAVHPDDETLGCGGTILKHKSEDDEIYWLILTKANQKITSIENIEATQKEYVRQAAIQYQFNEFFHLNFLTTELDQYSFGEIIRQIKLILDKIQPEILYIPNRSDIHSDHKIAFSACYASAKNFRMPFIKKILMYEILSETEYAPAVPENAFMPNVFIDITPFINKKLEIMKMFITEQMDEPLPRAMSSIKALNRYRGSRIGVKYAEAFMLLLEIN